MKYSETTLKKYIEKCFEDAFRAENREYSNELWNFEWIMIKNSAGIYQLYSITWCKFDRVLRRVKYRLQNNLPKNFGIHFGNTEEMRCMLYEDGNIDPNFTQAMFVIVANEKNVSLSIFDKKTNHFENNQSGECMPAYTYEKLLFKYWGMDASIYNTLPENDERRRLPDSVRENWQNYQDLYNRTFDVPIGNYDIICSSGIRRV